MSAAISGYYSETAGLHSIHCWAPCGFATGFPELGVTVIPPIQLRAHWRLDVLSGASAQISNTQSVSGQAFDAASGSGCEVVESC